MQPSESRDPAQGALLRGWLDGRIVPEFSERVLPVDAAVALRCAELHVPGRRAERDAFIAATAIIHGIRW
jgi:predicted nucleic acid-binding protein